MPVYPFYQVDAFASRAFEGNPACIVPMDAFPSDELLLKIAAENNVSETAFIVPQAGGVWALRWFTPSVEVPLCGHATLAAAHVLFEAGGYAGEQVFFDTRQSGRLSVRRLPDGQLELDFPSSPVRPVAVTEDICAALGARPLEAWGGMFYAARFDSHHTVRRLSPDHRRLKQLGAEGGGWDRGNFGCFALGGEEVSVTSRFFAPGSGIDEDPATGSWHTMLSRILATYFDVPEIRCYQAYPGRGAYMGVFYEAGRVRIRGSAVTVIEGQFRL